MDFSMAPYFPHQLEELEPDILMPLHTLNSDYVIFGGRVYGFLFFGYVLISSSIAATQKVLLENEYVIF